MEDMGLFDELSAASCNLQPIQADAPELPVPGLFVAGQRIVQSGNSAGKCAGLHKMA